MKMLPPYISSMRVTPEVASLDAAPNVIVPVSVAPSLMPVSDGIDGAVASNLNVEVTLPVLPARSASVASMVWLPSARSFAGV